MRTVCTRTLWLCLSATAVLLGACGGGGGGGSETGQQQGPLPGQSTNGAPAIQGQPGASVLVGQTYSFQPTVSDPDGDELSFSAENLPSWASLNSATGRVSGTPEAADVGTYAGITITVSDGRTQTTFGPFAIAVTQVSSGTATVAWFPPVENTDGSVLNDLAGYEIRYGQDSSDLSQSIVLDDPTLTVYVVENLTSGTWYFAVTAINSEGASSALSDIASKTIS